MNNSYGRGHLVPTSNSGSRNHTSNRIGDRLNIHFYGGGGVHGTKLRSSDILLVDRSLGACLMMLVTGRRGVAGRLVAGHRDQLLAVHPGGIRPQ